MLKCSTTKLSYVILHNLLSEMTKTNKSHYFTMAVKYASEAAEEFIKGQYPFITLYLCKSSKTIMWISDSSSAKILIRNNELLTDFEALFLHSNVIQRKLEKEINENPLLSKERHECKAIHKTRLAANNFRASGTPSIHFLMTPDTEGTEIYESSPSEMLDQNSNLLTQIGDMLKEAKQSENLTIFSQEKFKTAIFKEANITKADNCHLPKLPFSLVAQRQKYTLSSIKKVLAQGFRAERFGRGKGMRRYKKEKFRPIWFDSELEQQIGFKWNEFNGTIRPKTFKGTFKQVLLRIIMKMYDHYLLEPNNYVEKNTNGKEPANQADPKPASEEPPSVPNAEKPDELENLTVNYDATDINNTIIANLIPLHEDKHEGKQLLEQKEMNIQQKEFINQQKELINHQTERINQLKDEIYRQNKTIVELNQQNKKINQENERLKIRNQKYQQKSLARNR